MFKLSEVSEFEGTLYSHQDPVSPINAIPSTLELQSDRENLVMITFSLDGVPS